MNVRAEHLFFAFAVHATLIVFLLVGVQCSHDIQAPTSIQGVIISSQPKPVENPPTQPELPKPDEAELQRQQQEQKAHLEAEQQKQRQAAEAVQKALTEQHRQQELQKQQQLIAQQKAQQEAKQRAQELQKEAAEEETARKQAEDNKRKAALEAQRKADAEKKAKEAAAKQAVLDQKRREEELQAALGAEDQNKIVSEWGEQLASAIRRAWSRVAGTDDLKCTVKMQLSPTGDVVSASISQKSGSQLFDDSVIRAVYKAAPFPLPSDPMLLGQTINICFSPNPKNCQ
jgi:colicin import membrane protein